MQRDIRPRLAVWSRRDTADLCNMTGLTRRARLALAAALVCGCSSSALIRADDPSYRRAIEHYKRTRQIVSESLAPDDDQAMFLQAEGLFRYRFAPPGRGFGSYLAQT